MKSVCLVAIEIKTPKPLNANSKVLQYMLLLVSCIVMKLSKLPNCDFNASQNVLYKRILFSPCPEF